MAATHEIKLILCPSGHMHIVTGPGAPSWPFWSLETGLRLVEYMCVHLLDENTDAAYVRERLENEMRALARTQRRDRRGRFAQGHLLPRATTYYDQSWVATEWGRFFRGETACAMIPCSHPALPLAIPLRNCRFIAEKEGDTRPLTATEAGVYP